MSSSVNQEQTNGWNLTTNWVTRPSNIRKWIKTGSIHAQSSLNRSVWWDQRWNEWQAITIRRTGARYYSRSLDEDRAVVSIDCHLRSLSIWVLLVTGICSNTDRCCKMCLYLCVVSARLLWNTAKEQSAAGARRYLHVCHLFRNESLIVSARTCASPCPSELIGHSDGFYSVCSSCIFCWSLAPIDAISIGKILWRPHGVTNESPVNWSDRRTQPKVIEFNERLLYSIQTIKRRNICQNFDGYIDHGWRWWSLARQATGEPIWLYSPEVSLPICSSSPVFTIKLVRAEKNHLNAESFITCESLLDSHPTSLPLIEHVQTY